jgi:hypothetical protein
MRIVEGLAAPGRADENDELAIGGDQREILDGNDVAEALPYVPQLDRCHVLACACRKVTFNSGKNARSSPSCPWRAAHCSRREPGLTIGLTRTLLKDLEEELPDSRRRFCGGA